MHITSYIKPHVQLMSAILHIGETGRRIQVRANEHSKDEKSNIKQHSIKTGHPGISIDDFTILSRNNIPSTNRRKLEAIYIKR